MRVSPISRGPCRPLCRTPLRRSSCLCASLPSPALCPLCNRMPALPLATPLFLPPPPFVACELWWSPLPPCPAPLPTASISLIYRHPIGSALCTNPIGPPLRPSIPSDSSGQPRQIEGYNHPPPLFAASGIRSLCTVHWHRNSFLHSPSEPFSGSRPRFAEFSACLLDKL